jgi:hypothetical protein
MLPHYLHNSAITSANIVVVVIVSCTYGQPCCWTGCISLSIVCDNVILWENVGQNVVADFSRSQVQAKQASAHLLIKSRLLGYLQTRNQLPTISAFTNETRRNRSYVRTHLIEITDSGKFLALRPDISKPMTSKATDLLKYPYKVTGILALQPRNPASRVNFCNLFLSSVHEGSTAFLLITFVYDKELFHLRGSVLMK